MIVPARDAATTIGATLEALGRQDLATPHEVVVVDNGSCDDTAAIAQRAGATVVRRARGEGAGAARNAGVAVARGSVLAFTDADCIPTPGWLHAGQRALEHAGLVQGRVLPVPGTALGPYDRTLRVTRATGLFEAANAFVRREVFDRVGGFGPGLERTGREAPFGEDVVFGWRARRAGVRTAFCSEALVYHAVFPRTAAAYVAEHRRLGLFPALAREVPELRDAFFYRRCFLSRRTAAYAAAVLGAGTAVGRGRRLPLLAAAPYGAIAARDARPWGARAGLRVAAVRLVADTVGEAALARGSLAARTLVL